MTRPSVCAVVLAGGQSRRLDHQDKAMLELQGKTLLAHVIERLSGQTDDIVLCSGPQPRDFGVGDYQQITDDIAGFGGPLVGIYSAMLACRTEYLLVTACDTPFLPVDLATQLFDALDRQQGTVCLIADSQDSYPLPCLVPRYLLTDLKTWLDSGQRKTGNWLRRHKVALLQLPDEDGVFININTAADLERAEQFLGCL